jgi:hypothetical protein
MNTGAKAVLLGFATLLVTAAVVHGFLPEGLPAAIEKAMARKPGQETTDAPPPVKRAEETPAVDPAREAKTDSELRAAEKAYDAGEFGRALEHYVVARADADPESRARANRGLTKAVLAWGLTLQPKPPVVEPADPDAEVAKRQAQAESQGTERAWYDATMYAAGSAASRRRLPYLVGHALQVSQRGGPVEARLKQVLEIAGPRSELLRTAMVDQGILEPVDPVGPTSGPVVAKAPKIKPPIHTRIYPPTGKFKEATKAQLAVAVEWETQGAEEFALSGPDNAQRKEHRKTALELLKKARSVYQQAEEEDPDARGIGDRLKNVMEMISHLHKEMGFGE